MNITTETFEFSQEETPEEDTVTSVEMDDNLEFRAGRSLLENIDLEGFNQYGVRKNLNDDENLESVDIVYEAMEPGPPENRNGVRITEQFLKNVADHSYSNGEPYMLGHSDQPLDEIGKLRKVWFSDTAEKLMVMNRVFNTGASTHDEVINRMTHDPPTMTDGSVGFGDNYEAVVNADDEPELIDGKIREFSTVPFPGGYDDGGVGLPSSAFAEQVLEEAETQFDDGEQDGNSLENSASVVTETITF